jgi:hypothetical protein
MELDLLARFHIRWLRPIQTLSAALRQAGVGESIVTQNNAAAGRRQDTLTYCSSRMLKVTDRVALCLRHHLRSPICFRYLNNKAVDVGRVLSGAVEFGGLYFETSKIIASLEAGCCATYAQDADRWGSEAPYPRSQSTSNCSV